MQITWLNLVNITILKLKAINIYSRLSGYLVLDNETIY